MNKQERHEAYKKMLHVATDENRGILLFGFCNMINALFSINAHHASSFAVEFPELYSKKPEPGHNYFNIYWFPGNREGWKQRIELLKQCIEETKPTESLQSE